jgi:hypothetical protein
MRRPGFRRALRRVRASLSFRADLQLHVASATAVEALGELLPVPARDEDAPDSDARARAQQLGRLLALVKTMHARERFTLARERAEDEAEQEEDGEDDEHDKEQPKPPVVVRWTQIPLNVPRIVMEYMRRFRKDEHRPLGEILDQIELTEQRSGLLEVCDLRRCRRPDDPPDSWWRGFEGRKQPA